MELKIMHSGKKIKIWKRFLCFGYKNSEKKKSKSHSG